jgi:hypothetical protein
LEEEIDATADDASALTDTQREKQEQALLDQILIAEREECALIEMAAADGTMIAYRPERRPRPRIAASTFGTPEMAHPVAAPVRQSFAAAICRASARCCGWLDTGVTTSRRVTAQGVSRVIRLFGPKGTPTPLG